MSESVGLSLVYTGNVGTPREEGPDFPTFKFVYSGHKLPEGGWYNQAANFILDTITRVLPEIVTLEDTSKFVLKLTGLQLPCGHSSRGYEATVGLMAEYLEDYMAEVEDYDDDVLVDIDVSYRYNVKELRPPVQGRNTIWPWGKPNTEVESKGKKMTSVERILNAQESLRPIVDVRVKANFKDKTFTTLFRGGEGGATIESRDFSIGVMNDKSKALQQVLEALQIPITQDIRSYLYTPALERTGIDKVQVVFRNDGSCVWQKYND